MVCKSRFFLTVLFVQMTVISIAQISITGRVLNESNESLPYATINIEGSKCGTLSDENGYFELSCLKDTIEERGVLVRYLGYETKKLNVEEFDNYKEIILSPTGITLEEISVLASRRSNKDIYKIEYDINKPRYYYQTNVESTYQLASYIENNNKSSGYLSEIVFYVGKAASDKVPIRLNFYNVDFECSCPNKELNSRNIIVNVKRGRNRIDLKEYEIILNGNDFYVAFEWLSVAAKEKKEFDFSIGMIPFKSKFQLLEKEGGLEWQKLNRGSQSRIWTKIKLVKDE